MDKKQHIFRTTDKEYELLKEYLKQLRKPKPEKVSPQAPTRPLDVQQFLDTAEKWYGAMKQLVEIGTIKQIPQIFTGGAPAQQISPTGIVSGGIVELPPFVEDVLNGGTYPNPEDCTEEERAVLYDAKFKALFKAYTQAKDDRVRNNLRESVFALVREILG
jgi:hypothetical protein